MALTMELVEAARKGAILTNGVMRARWWPACPGSTNGLQWIEEDGTLGDFVMLTQHQLDAEWRIEQSPGTAYSYTLMA